MKNRTLNPPPDPIVKRLLDQEGSPSFGAAVMAEVRAHGGAAVVDAICRIIDMKREAAASVLLDAVQGEGDVDVEEELRRITGEG